MFLETFHYLGKHRIVPPSVVALVKCSKAIIKHMSSRCWSMVVAEVAGTIDLDSHTFQVQWSW